MFAQTDSPPEILRPSARKKPVVAPISVETAPVSKALPRWTTPNDAANPPLESIALRAGANLFALDAIIRAEPAWLGCFRQRQALDAAVSCARILRLDADVASLRDAKNLTRVGDDPGAAVKMLEAWAMIAAHPTRFDATTPKNLAEKLGFSIADEAIVAPSQASDPVATAAATAQGAFRAAVAQQRETFAAEIFAFMLADIALAKKLGWHAPVPLFAASIFDATLRSFLGGRRARVIDSTWRADAYAIIAHACASAFLRAQEIERRAEGFLAAAKKVRTKGAGAAIEAFLNEDSVAPKTLAKKLGSDRAARRFCERLEKLGGARELTGRPTFRLYGL